jgi:hypothetical protein
MKSIFGQSLVEGRGAPMGNKNAAGPHKKRVNHGSGLSYPDEKLMLPLLNRPAYRNQVKSRAKRSFDKTKIKVTAQQARDMALEKRSGFQNHKDAVMGRMIKRDPWSFKKISYNQNKSTR